MKEVGWKERKGSSHRLCKYEILKTMQMRGKGEYNLCCYLDEMFSPFLHSAHTAV